MIKGIKGFGKFWFRLFVSLILRRKRKILVCGMRRSGNHACVDWLINSLEQDSTSRAVVPTLKRVSISNTGKTVFLNEINEIRPFHYIRILLELREHIGRAEHVVMSAEDVNSTFRYDYRVPFTYEGIFVRRTLLNVVASRLRRLQEKARMGVGWDYQNVDRALFDKIASWSTAPDGFEVWSYDEWVVSESWRLAFLSRFGMSVDIVPPVASEGGGSSFTGGSNDVDSRAARERFETVEIPEPVRRELMRSEIWTLLTEREKNYLRKSSSVPAP